jgi:hypothetical protein
MAVPPSRKAERVDEQVPVQLAMSLDGYVAGPDQSEEHPLGVGRDVPLGGGASVVQQYLAAGLVDEFELYLVAVLLGDASGCLRTWMTSTSSRCARSRRPAHLHQVPRRPLFFQPPRLPGRHP